MQRFRLIVIVFLAISAAVRAACAQEKPEPAPEPPLESGEFVSPLVPSSSWRGELHLPGGLPLEITVHFDIPILGAGTMDIPANGMKGEPLSAVRRSEEYIRFALTTAGRVGAAAQFDLTLDKSGSAAEGTMTQHGQTFKVTLQRMDPKPPEDGAELAPSRPQTPEEPFLYVRRQVSYTNAADVVRINGVLTIPGQPPPGAVFDDVRHPVAIIIGPADARDHDGTIEGHKPFWVLADHLAMNGIAALRLDDRGVGGSVGNKEKASFENLLSDLRGAIGILRVYPDIDTDRIALIGFEQGATLAARAGAESPGVVGVVLIATRLAPPAALKNAPKEALPPTTDARPALNLRGGVEERSDFWDQFDHDTDHDQMQKEGAFPVEVRILDGLNSVLQRVPEGVDAGDIGAIEQTIAPEALQAITEWLTERFND